jgi:hypothetical protein
MTSRHGPNPNAPACPPEADDTAPVSDGSSCHERPLSGQLFRAIPLLTEMLHQNLILRPPYTASGGAGVTVRGFSSSVPLGPTATGSPATVRSPSVSK